MNETRKKRQKPTIGDLVAIPLTDGSFGLGHVVNRTGRIMVTVVLLTDRASAAEGLPSSSGPGEPIACFEVTGEDIRDGSWPIVGRHVVDYPPDVAPKVGTSWSDNICDAVLDRWHGVREYETRGLLLPGVTLPDQPPGGVAATSTAAQSHLPAQPTSSPPPTEGPAEICIVISYEGEGLPSIEQLRPRQELERRIEAGALGEVTDAGAGDGLLEVYVETADVAKAYPGVVALVDELGLADRTIVEVSALDNDP